MPIVIGQSPNMCRVREAISTAAQTDGTVLISGECGAGKDLIARAIHATGARRLLPFRVIRSGAIENDEAMAALRAPYAARMTGEDGTIFLDEIGGLSLSAQDEVLRFVRGVGGEKDGPTAETGVRYISSTSCDLESKAKAGQFRAELLYRLSAFRIEIAPLRERKEDIPLLVEHFIRELSLEMNRPIGGASSGARELLRRQRWPGNVRELKNAVERAMIYAQGLELREQDFRLEPPAAPPEGNGKALESVERAHILRVLAECGENQSRTAELLGIDRVTLYHKLKKYGWRRTATQQR